MDTPVSIFFFVFIIVIIIKVMRPQPCCIDSINSNNTDSRACGVVLLITQKLMCTDLHTCTNSSPGKSMGTSIRFDLF